MVPPAVRRQAGLKSGDELEFKVSGRVITILPRLPPADEGYTAAQRQVIDRGIAKGMEDIRKGRFHGPFKTAAAAVSHLQSLSRSRRVFDQQPQSPFLAREEV